MFNIILGYIWHYVVWAWPYFAVMASLALVNIGMFYLGRWLEHRKWRREIKSGKLLGELAQEQLKKRDARNRQLTGVIKYREDQIERVGIKHQQLLGLAQEMINVAVSEESKTLRRRKRAWKSSATLNADEMWKINEYTMDCFKEEQSE